MATDSADSIELVVTGPGSFGPALAYKTRSRTTVGVLTQLLVEAEHEIIVGAPYLQEGHGLSGGPLGTALLAALGRGVNVDIMTTARGFGTLDHEQLMRAARGRLRFFRPLANVQDERRLGSHAKFCLVDGAHAYVGSANLTGPGLTEHVELGLLVRGTVARQIRAFWACCTEIGLFVLVNGPEPSQTDR